MMGPLIGMVLLFLLPDLFGWSISIYLLAQLIHEHKHLKMSTQWVWMWSAGWVLSIIGFCFQYLELIFSAPLLWVISWFMFRADKAALSGPAHKYSEKDAGNDPIFPKLFLWIGVGIGMMTLIAAMKDFGM